MGGLLLATVVLTAAPACASGGVWVHTTAGRPPYSDVRERERIAYERGAREGRDAGRSDARRGRRFDPERHPDYRRADAGYKRSWGPIDEYRRAFRDGFRRGYEDGFRGPRPR